MVSNVGVGKSKGFTLIELLVVIAIIALLMSILVPALARVKDQAKTIGCRSNLRQWNLYFSLYTEDHNGRFEAGIGNGRFIAGDAFDVAALVPDRVNFVFLANAFHGVPDKPRLAAAVREALKPSGLFAIVNWHARRREETIVLGEPRGPATALRMSPEATRAAVEPSGFALAHEVEVSLYHYGAVFRRIDS